MAVLVLLGAATAAFAQEGEVAGERPSFESLYGELASNNIFRRDRRPPPPPDPPREEPPPPPPPPPETQWLLTGVVWEEGGFRGYFEHLPDGQTRRVTAGESLLTGTIGELFIDSVSFVSAEGAIVWVDVGDDLTGERSKITVAGGRDDDEPKDGDNAEGGGETSERDQLIQRMRERRERERGGG